MPSPIDIVSAYFHAKDGNRPHLMRSAFAQDAELEMAVKTDAISFPDSVTGLDDIVDVLIRRFANEFENIYTFGLARPSAADRRHFHCPWLVGMSAKNDGPLRVGCGRYDWYFSPDERCLVEKFVINIDVMRVPPATECDAIMAWLSGLPYPWCAPADAARAMPDVDELSEIGQYLREIQSEPR